MSLSRAADVALITTCILVGSVVVWNNFRPTPAGRIETGYELGAVTDLTGLIDFKRAKATLVVYLKSDCRFCTESMHFYRKLGAIAASNERFKLVAVGPEPETTISQYLDSNDVDTSAVLSLKASVGKFLGSPTLVLVDSGGIVLNEWRGRLDTAGEEAVTAQVFESIR